MAKRKRKKTVQEIKRLQREYHDLARSANNRMTRLEKLAKNPEYAAVLGYAYKDAAYDIKNLFGASGRFPQDVSKMAASKTDVRQMKQYITSVKNFLESPSSTKTGIDKVYRKRASTLNKSQGTNFTVSDMRTFFDSSVWKKMNSKFGSKTAMKVIDNIQKNSDQIAQEAEDARRRHRSIDYSTLHDVDGRDIMSELSSHDKNVISKLADMFAGRN